MIEPELQVAVDAFFDQWKARIVKRLEVGEQRYKGSWKDMTEAQVAAELFDEVTDMIAYAIFFQSKLRRESP